MGMTLPRDAQLFTWCVVIDYPLFAVSVALIASAWFYSLVIALLQPIASTA